MTLRRKLNVLIVDDSPTILRMVGDVLQAQFDKEIEVTAMTDPHEVVPLLNHYCCDILLSDVEMPGRSGLEVVAACMRRAHRWHRALRGTLRPAALDGREAFASDG